MCIKQPEARGTVNGYGEALAALGHTFGPIIGAPLFAWSENSGSYLCYVPRIQACSYTC